MRRGNIKNKDRKDIDITNNVDVIKEVEENSQPINPMTNSNGTVKGKNTDKVKVIILVVFIIVALAITAGLLVYKYIEINKTITNLNRPESSNNNTQIKIESADSKYLVDYGDMYTINPITIVEKEYIDGTIQVNGETENRKRVTYIQISGLKNKQVQNKINEELKTSAFNLHDTITAKQQYLVDSYVKGNFSNILSVCVNIYIYENYEIVNEKNIYLNYNLVTGEKIKFLDLFADNTPMNSIIYDIKYESLAWDTELNFEFSEQEWDNATNMDKRDTSEYEDIILKAINKYKSLDKDNIEFYVTPNRLTAKLNINEDDNEGLCSITLYKYRDYITMYKKFLTDEKIYEVEPNEKLIVFNYMHDFKPRYYKKETDNLFISIFCNQDSIYGEEQEQEYVSEYGNEVVNLKNKLLNEKLENIISESKKLANKNKNTKGYMARYSAFWNMGEYSNGYGEENFICISIYGELSEMDIDYYNENAFKLLAKSNVRQVASVDDLFTGRLDYENKNIKSLTNEEDMPMYSADWYYDFNGNFIADSYDEMQEYLDSKYK